MNSSTHTASDISESIGPDRVRAHTDPELLNAIDERIASTLRLYQKQPSEIDRRVKELDHEWDMERVLETNAASLALVSLALGVLRGRKWFLITGGVLGFLLQHAIQGWCPPVRLFRRLGVRTQQEIDVEKFSLQAMNGHFHRPASQNGAQRPNRSSRKKQQSRRSARK